MIFDDEENVNGWLCVGSARILYWTRDWKRDKLCTFKNPLGSI